MAHIGTERFTRNRYPDERSAVLDVFLDLSHGVFVDPNARDMWREHYLAALRLDIPAPLSFDINTVQPGILELIPGITPAEIDAWVEQRERQPFQMVADFKERMRLGEAALASMTLEP